MKPLFLRTQDPGPRTQLFPCRLFPSSLLSLLPSSLHPLLPSSLRPLSGRKNRAFTLIEIALTLLAIGLGLIAIFGLGRLGLQATKETNHDQRCEMMANAVFETLREYNARFVDEARTNHNGRTWWYYWNKARTDNESGIGFPLIAGISLPVSQINLVFNKITPAYDINYISLANWNPLYGLVVNPKYGSQFIPDYWNCIQADLHIYPDGDTYSSEHRIFHTTLSNPGGLP